MGPQGSKVPSLEGQRRVSLSRVGVHGDGAGKTVFKWGVGRKCLGRRQSFAWSEPAPGRAVGSWVLGGWGSEERAGGGFRTVTLSYGMKP